MSIEFNMSSNQIKTQCLKQDFIKSDHDDLGDVDINDISEDEIR